MKSISQLVRTAKLKRTFKVYDAVVREFNLGAFGQVKLAQWLHPLEKPKALFLSQVDFYRRLIARGGLAIDIGAHTGDTSIPMALAAGPDGLVLAFEPNKYAFSILQKNAGLNPELTRIDPLPYAITQEDGEFVFDYSDASYCNGGFLSKIKNKKGHRYRLAVTGRNLERFLVERYRDVLPRLQFIKTDAEGYDKEILKSVSNILNQFRPNLMFECYKRLTESERIELYEVVSEAGYDMYLAENFQSNRPATAMSKSDMMRTANFDVIALPNPRRGPSNQ